MAVISAALKRAPTRAVPVRVGSALAAACAGLYLAGAGRAFDFDGSVGIRRFIATPSLADPFVDQIEGNNHPLLSLLDHIVHTLTGTVDERALRAIPIAVAAITVGLLGFEMSRRLGAAAGVAAGGLLMVNPLSMNTLPEVRGYGLLLLSAVASTILLFRIIETDDPPRRWVAGYVGALAIGVASFPAALAFWPVHAAIVVRRPRDLRRWAPRWVAAAAIGIVPFVLAIARMRPYGADSGFQWLFPLRLLRESLGGGGGVGANVVVGLAVGVLALVGALPLLRAGTARRAAAAVVCVIGLAWAAAPTILYPRYFLWTVALTAAAAGVGVARTPPLGYVAVGLVATMLALQIPHLSEDRHANREAGRLMTATALQGRSACVFSGSWRGVSGYAGAFTIVDTPHDLEGCDMVASLYVDAPGERALARSAGERFPYRRILPAITPGIVYASQPWMLRGDAPGPGVGGSTS